MITKLGWIYKNQIVTYHKMLYFTIAILFIFCKLFCNTEVKLKHNHLNC